MINDRTIWFSLGNFVFDQHFPDSRKAQMASLEIYRDAIICKTHNGEIVGNSKFANEK